MKFSSFIKMIFAVLLGLGLSGLAIESPVKAAGSVALSQVSGASGGRTVTNTFHQTTTVTVDPCAPTYTASSHAGKVDLRSQHVLAQSSLPTITIRRTSTLHSTITLRLSLVAPTLSGSVKVISTRTRITFETSTTTTTVSAASSVTSAHGLSHPPTSKLESDDFDPFDYEFIEDNSKIELRDLAVSSSTSSAACPTDISGDYQFPHLLVPTSIGMPDQAQGTQYTVWISPAASTLFNFDVPATYTGTCSLIFLFPYMSQLDPTAGKYTYSGQEQVIYQNGGLNFALLSGVATNSTTYNSTPPVAVDYGKVKILPGNKYTVAVFPCPAGKTITVEGSSANKTELDYFQNTGMEPIGLYLVPCV